MSLGSVTMWQMIQEIEQGAETPLADWLVANPIDYPKLCDEITRGRQRIEHARFALEDNLRNSRPVAANTARHLERLERTLAALIEARDRAAEMLGYEERPRSEWEEDPYFGWVPGQAPNDPTDFRLDPTLFPREDSMGFPLGEYGEEGDVVLTSPEEVRDFFDRLVERRWGPEDGGTCPCGGMSCDGTCDSN